MFTRLSKHLLVVASILALGFYCYANFSLDSDRLVKKKDYFSKLNKNPKHKELFDFISLCTSGDREKCLALAPNMYAQKNFASFKNLIAELAVEVAVLQKVQIADLQFLDKNNLFENELLKIIFNYEEKDLQQYFDKVFFGKDHFLSDLILRKPNVLCKFKFNKTFVEKSLIRISEQEDFHNLNFSDFPCGLSMEGEYKILKKEISEARSKKNKDYKFNFLEDEVSLYYYKKFSYSKRGKLATKAKRYWNKIVQYEDYIQKRIVINHFYKRDYDILSSIDLIEKEVRDKIAPEVYQYILKAAAAIGKEKQVNGFTDNLNYKTSEWAEEVYLMRATRWLRERDYSKAVLELNSLIKYSVNLKLSGLYWLWVSLSKTSPGSTELQDVEKQILKNYPFSYYGILVATQKEGKDFFKKYKTWVRLQANFTNLAKDEVERLKFYYSYGLFDYFKKTFFSIDHKLNEKQKVLFTLVFSNMSDQMEVVRALNTLWDNLPNTRANPFLQKSFPQKYKKKIKRNIKKLNYMKLEHVWAVMRQESVFTKQAQSPAGAKGLMQIVPGTGKEVARQLRIKSYKNSDSLFIPEINIKIGSKYMDRLINASQGYLPYAYASYNAGPGRMYRWSKKREDVKSLRKAFKDQAYDPISELWVEELPWSETRFYVKAVLRNQGIYKALKRPDSNLGCYPFWWCS